MDYCSAVWSGAAPNEINRLFKIQKRGVRLILDKDFNEPHEVLFSSLHWSPIQSRLIYRKSLLVYQAINKLLPYYLQNMFTKVKDVVLRVTRSSNTTNLILPFPRIELFKRSFSYSGAILFNQLDNKIKHANSVNSLREFTLVFLSNTCHSYDKFMHTSNSQINSTSIINIKYVYITTLAL